MILLWVYPIYSLLKIHYVMGKYDVPHRCNLGRGHTTLTSRELMWCYACSWNVRGDLTLNHITYVHEMCETTEIWEACWHVSWPELHVRSRDVSSDRSVNLHHRIQCQIASHIPTASITSHELMWREDSVFPALAAPVILPYEIFITA